MPLAAKTRAVTSENSSGAAPRVVGYAGREALAGEGLLQVVAEPLGGAADDEAVHPVVAAADDAAQAARAELEVAIEAVLELLPVLGLEQGLDLGAELRVALLGQRNPRPSPLSRRGPWLSPSRSIFAYT